MESGPVHGTSEWSSPHTGMLPSWPPILAFVAKIEPFPGHLFLFFPYRGETQDFDFLDKILQKLFQLTRRTPIQRDIAPRGRRMAQAESASSLICYLPCSVKE